MEAARRPYLTAKFQIGSCKGPLSFGAEETVFHPDDVPEDRKRNKAVVNKWKRGDVGPGEKGPWQPSVWLDPTVRRRIRQNSEFDRPNMYQYNCRAEELPRKNPEPIPRPSKFKIDVMSADRKAQIQLERSKDRASSGHAHSIMEMPVHSRLQGEKAWNASIEMNSRDRLDQSRTADARARQNSASFSTKLTDYVPPHKQQAGIARKKKNSPPEREAFVGTTHYVNREAARPTTKTRTFAHSGTFEFNEREGEWMWSDTGSFVKDSPGDLVRVTNPNAFNIASPTSAA